MEHMHYCPMATLGHSDAAKRLSDTYNLHRIGAGWKAVRRWIAVRLDDGTSDQVLYDTKLDAVTHQHHNEKFYAFIRIVPSSMTECDAEIMLRTHRTLYENGLRIADPDHKHGGMDVIKRSSIEDQFAQIRGINTNLILPEGY